MQTTASNFYELTSIRNQWAAEFGDGLRCALTHEYEGPRECGGYPQGFHRWTPDRRNAWFAGFNHGFHERIALTKEVLGYELL